MALTFELPPRDPCNAPFRKLLHTRPEGIWGRDAAQAVLHVPPAFHSLEHGDFVGVLDVAADRDSHGNSSDLHSRALQLLREINRGGFAFDRRIGRDDNFIDIAGIDTGYQV